jgi:tetratricopeptide (TPR) repeat protein
MTKKLSAKQQRFATYLAAQTKETLVDMLLEVSWRDDRLAQSLLVKSTLSGKQNALVDELRQVIDDVTYVDGFVDWRSMHSFSDPLDQAVDTLTELLTPEHAAALVELAQYAIEQTEAALESVDDSNGQVGDILCRLGELHLKACKLARPDPVELAHDLFHLETSLPFGVCSFSALTYKDALGAKGLQSYRALAQAQWDALAPAGKNSGFNHDRFKITHVMEDLARASGDVDELISIKAQDLGHSLSYLTIAELLTENKRHDEALQWAERGLLAHPDRPDNRLRDFLVAAYLKRKRSAEALQLIWIQFEERPGLEHYQKLHALAVKLALWPAQRERALACLAAVIAREASQTTRWQPKPSVPDMSRRLAIALWEEDLDAAWLAVQSGQCEQRLRISLAKALGPTRAQDAMALYRQAVPELVGQTNNDAYASAVTLVCEVQKLLAGLGQQPQFASYVAELRLAFKPKRNFIKLLDGIGVPR